jgi:hypothetical protein
MHFRSGPHDELLIRAQLCTEELCCDTVLSDRDTRWRLNSSLRVQKRGPEDT